MEPSATTHELLQQAAQAKGPGDPARALAVLEQMEVKLGGSDDASGQAWRNLADRFAELGSTTGVLRCLAAGLANAISSYDLCCIARGYDELVAERDTARTLLERAESLARDEDPRSEDIDYWAIASCWLELFHDPVRARAVLETGLARAYDVTSCLSIAQAPPCHYDRVRRSLAKARGLAKTFDDWLSIAKATRECFGSKRARIRAALREAEACSETPSERRQLQWVQARWFGDTIAEMPPEPIGPSPDELAAKGISPSGWEQDAGALFDWLRPQMADSMLVAIAEAEGGYLADEHLTMLRDIVHSGRLPVPLRWVPREVLALSSYSGGRSGDRVQNAFCSVLLCLAELAEEPGGPGDGVEMYLAGLMESCMVLGPEALGRVEGLLVALLEMPEADLREGAFAALGLLLAAGTRDARDSRLEALAARLLAIDAELVKNGCYVHPEHGFVLGATCFDGENEVWKRMAHAVFAEWHEDPAKPALSEVVRRLLGR